MKRSPALLAALVLAASSCAQNNARYPSLLPRAVESRSDSEAVAPMPVVAPDPVLDTRIADIVAALAKADTAFDAAQADGAAAAGRARGAAVGSDAWLDAQVVLAALSAARARSETALTDAEALAIARAAGSMPAYPELTELQATAAAQVDRQTMAIDAVAAQVARPPR